MWLLFNIIIIIIIILAFLAFWQCPFRHGRVRNCGGWRGGGRDWSVFARNAWLMVGLVCWVWRWGKVGTVIWDSLCIVVMHKLCGVGGGGGG